MSTQITSVSAKINIGGEETLIDGFRYNSESGYWEKEVIAPSVSSYLNNDEHYYPVSVTANDQAGNSKTATVSDFDTLKLFVIEKEVPTVTITGINDGATVGNAKPTISISVSDTNSGVSTEGAYVIIDGSSEHTPVALTSTNAKLATGTFTPVQSLDEGNHIIQVYCKDNDGNFGVSSVSFIVLTSAPILNVESPADETTITNVSTVTVSGNTNTGTGNVVTITLNGADQGDVTLDENGNFSKTLTLVTDGVYKIIVTSTNSVGKPTVVERTVILDTVLPVFKDVKITPQRVELDGTTQYVISVKVE